MTSIATFLLVIVGALCCVAIFHPLYRDNLVECIGLSIVGGYCFLEVEHLFLHPHPIREETVVLYIGLVVFGVGKAASKVAEEREQRH